MEQNYRIRYNLISADFDAQTGVSIVTIGTDLGIFKGHARVHESDKEFTSEIRGCTIAELKACEKYANAKVNYYQTQLKALNRFFNVMKDTREYNEKAFYVKQLNHIIKDLKDREKFWTHNIYALNHRLMNYIKDLEDYKKIIKMRHD